jgi:hypothetical protein
MGGGEGEAGMEGGSDEGNQLIEDADHVQLRNSPIFLYKFFESLLFPCVWSDDLVVLRTLDCK